MEVRSKDGTIVALSGRIGNFMFRTYKDGKMTVYYKPKRKNTTEMDREWTENDSIMDELRGMLMYLRMEIVESGPGRNDATEMHNVKQKGKS